MIGLALLGVALWPAAPHHLLRTSNEELDLPPERA